MGVLLTIGGALVAFFAGGVALFTLLHLFPRPLRPRGGCQEPALAPPATHLLLLAFLFSAGLAVVLVPLTVGISLIAGAIAKYHAVLYYAGGTLMLVQAAYTLSGRMWSLPSFLRTPRHQRMTAQAGQTSYPA